MTPPPTGLSQSSEAVSSSDGAVDAAKMAEVESRLAAQTTEMERLKVCRISVKHHITLIYPQYV